MTTIAIPMRDGRFCEHFGGAESFALYSIEDGRKSVDERRMMSPPEHGRGVFPMWLRQVGAEVILAGGMGPMAIDMFQQFGIEVATGAIGKVGRVIDAYLAGQVQGAVAEEARTRLEELRASLRHALPEGGLGGRFERHLGGVDRVEATVEQRELDVEQRVTGQRAFAHAALKCLLDRAPVFARHIAAGNLRLEFVTGVFLCRLDAVMVGLTEPFPVAIIHRASRISVSGSMIPRVTAGAA